MSTSSLLWFRAPAAGPPIKAALKKNKVLCPDSYGSSEILLWSATSSYWLKEKTRTDVSTLSGTSGKAEDQIQQRFWLLYASQQCQAAVKLLVCCSSWNYSCFASLHWYRAARAHLRWALYRASSTGQFTWYAHTRECVQHLKKVCRWKESM